MHGNLSAPQKMYFQINRKIFPQRLFISKLGLLEYNKTELQYRTALLKETLCKRCINMFSRSH